MNTRIFWCLGLYASGSTWLFNVVRQIAMASRQGDVQTHFCSEGVDLAALRRPAGYHVVKSHEIVGEADANYLAELMSRCIVTIRDPRDAVCSLLSYHHHEFQQALDQVHKAARLCGRLAADPRTLLLKYEDGFFDDLATLDQVARHLGIELTASDRDRIFAASRRAEVEKHIASLNRLPGALLEPRSRDWLDPETHWHTHHSGRTGEVGKWKTMLSQDQVLAIQTQLADCFQFKI